MRILNWGHVAQIFMVLAVIVIAFVKIGTGNVRGRSDVWGLSVVSLALAAVAMCPAKGLYRVSNLSSSTCT